MTDRSVTSPARIAGRLLGTLACLFVATELVRSWLRVLRTGRATRVDFVALDVAARLSAGSPEHLYDLDVQRAVQLALDPGTGPARPFTNPPFVATYARPVLWLGSDGGYLALGVLNVALLAVIGGLLLRATRGRHWSERTLAVTAALTMITVGNAMAEGTISVLVALGVCCYLLGEHRDDDRLRAVGLALTACKPHLAVLVWGLAVVRRRWRATAWGAGLLAVLAAPSLASPGIGAWLRYPGALLQAGGADAAAVEHSAHWWNLASVGYRTLPAEVVTALALPAFVVGFGVVLAAHRRRPDLLTPGSALALGLVLVPHANPHDAIWLPLAHALLRSHASWEARPVLARRALTVLAVLSPLLGLYAVGFADEGGSALAVAGLVAYAGLTTRLGATGAAVHHLGDGRRAVDTGRPAAA